MWQHNNNSAFHHRDNLSKSDQEISSQMADLDFLDILLSGGHSSRSQGNNNNNNSENFSSKNNFFSHRNRTLSCNSVVLEDFGSSKSCCSEDGGILEHWEPGEILERSFAQYPRDTHSEPGTPSKIQETYFSGDSSFDDGLSTKHRNQIRPSKVVGGKKRGPRPKKLTWEEKRLKRSEANNRERQRMGQLNTAFDNLRHLLPKHGNDRELSKFETIQIAKNYIKALNEMIRQTDAASGIFHDVQSPEQQRQQHQQQQDMQFCF